MLLQLLMSTARALFLIANKITRCCRIVTSTTLYMTKRSRGCGFRDFSFNRKSFHEVATAQLYHERSACKTCRKTFPPRNFHGSYSYSYMQQLLPCPLAIQLAKSTSMLPESFPTNNHFHSKHKNFPPQMFRCTYTYSNCNALCRNNQSSQLYIAILFYPILAGDLGHAPRKISFQKLQLATQNCCYKYIAS